MRITVITLSVDSPYLGIPQEAHEDFASLVKELEVNTVGKKLVDPHRLKARQAFMFGNFFLTPSLLLQRLYGMILINLFLYHFRIRRHLISFRASLSEATGCLLAGNVSILENLIFTGWSLHFAT